MTRPRPSGGGAPFSKSWKSVKVILALLKVGSRNYLRPRKQPLHPYTFPTIPTTKRSKDPVSILEDMPRNRKLSAADLEFCLSEFERIKLLRRFAEEA